MVQISILHPTRDRPKQAYKTYESWVRMMGDNIKMEYIISIDDTEPQKHEYIELFRNNPNVRVLISDNTDVVTASNAAAEISTGEIIVLVSDDFECYPQWGREIILAFEGQTTGAVLKTFDGTQGWIVTLPIMNRKYYDEQGYFYCPAYKHMFCDTDMTHKADLEGKLIVRNDLVFKHAHYSTGAMEKDATNTKADATWGQGESIYLMRVKNKFNLPGDVDVLNINPDAGPHLNWLKNKLQ